MRSTIQIKKIKNLSQGITQMIIHMRSSNDHTNIFFQNLSQQGGTRNDHSTNVEFTKLS